jgi:serralysin
MLQECCNVLDISFTEASGGSHLTFINKSLGGKWAGQTVGELESQNTEIDLDYSHFNITRHIILHEIGHALGLDHNDLNASLTNMNASGENSAQNLLAWDIAALQNKWGADSSYHAENNEDTFSDNQGTKCIWDTGGNDTLRYTGSQAVKINLHDQSEAWREPNYFTNASGTQISIARGVTIENAVGGAGDDTLVGNNADNILDGAGGYNVMKGGGGNDTIKGAGQVEYNDNYSHYAFSWNAQTNALTVTTLGASGEGTDLVSGASRISFRNAWCDVGWLNGTGGTFVLLSGSGKFTGSAGSDDLIIGTANNVLTGGGGADTFEGIWDGNTITDFHHSEGDKIRTYFTENLSQLSISYDASGAYVTENNHTLHLLGVSKLEASDFIFALPA